MSNLALANNSSRLAMVSAVVTFLVSTFAVAAGSGSHEHGEHKSTSESEPEGGHQHHQHQFDWGEVGEANEVTRTLEIVMDDIYFEPGSIKARRGETLRFVLKNVGNLIHEFNIGTSHMHEEHRQEMAGMVQSGIMTATSLSHEKMAQGDLKHDDANSVLLEPGQAAELIWKFTQARDLEFACNVPGHYEAGMIGVLSVKEALSGVVD